MRIFFKRDVRIRLTDSGFVETTRYFGLWERCLLWIMAESDVQEGEIVRQKRDENKRQ
jgi:hypothetical protein